MKNEITLLTLATLVVFTSTSCFISFGVRGGREHRGDRDYVEPLKNGMEHASVVPLKLNDTSPIPVCSTDNYSAD